MQSLKVRLTCLQYTLTWTPILIPCKCYYLGWMVYFSSYWLGHIIKFDMPSFVQMYDAIFLFLTVMVSVVVEVRGLVCSYLVIVAVTLIVQTTLIINRMTKGEMTKGTVFQTTQPARGWTAADICTNCVNFSLPQKGGPDSVVGRAGHRSPVPGWLYS